jgi:hypothetical protein
MVGAGYGLQSPVSLNTAERFENALEKYTVATTQGECMKNRAVVGFVAPHGLRLIWSSNDLTHGCAYASAISLQKSFSYRVSQQLPLRLIYCQQSS